MKILPIELEILNFFKACREYLGKADNAKLSANIGYSVGVDSSVLLYVCNKYKHELNIEIVASYVIFDDDDLGPIRLNNAKQVCADMSIPLQITAGDATNHNAARLSMRSSFIKSRADVIITGHHYNDIVETVLFRLFRGTSIDGLYADRIHTYKTETSSHVFGKPLFYIKKEDLIKYAIKHSITYMEDKTNLDNNHSRNYIRNIVIPVIEEKFGVAGIFKTAEMLEIHANLLKNTSFLNIGDDSWEKEKFLSLDLDRQLYYIKYSCVKKYGINLKGTVLNNTRKFLSNNISGKLYLVKDISLILDKNEVSIIKQEN